MDLNLLSLFAEIAEAPSLSAAARRLGVTRSHVSQRLQSLERQLGAQLMRRTTRRLELTEAGQIVYEHGLRVRREADAVASSVGTLGQDTAGSVRLSIPTGFGRLVVAPLLMRFQQQHRRIALSVRFSNRIDDLVAAQIDVAVKIGASLPQDHVARELGRIRWRLCASPDYLAGRTVIRVAADLADQSFVCPPISGRRLALQVGRTTMTFGAPRMQSEDFWLLRDAVQAGIGIGLLPSYMVQEALDAGALVALLPNAKIGSAGEAVHLVTTQSPYPSLAQRVLVDFLATNLKARLDAS